MSTVGVPALECISYLVLSFIFTSLMGAVFVCGVCRGLLWRLVALMVNAVSACGENILGDCIWGRGSYGCLSFFVTLLAWCWVDLA